jgi:hypothetical protein
MCAVAVPICTLLAVFGYAVSDFVDAHVVEPAQKHFHMHRRPHARHTPYVVSRPAGRP